MNKHYMNEENNDFDVSQVFRPEQEGKPLEITRKLESLGKDQIQEEHFEDLKDRRGLKKETVKKYVKPVNQGVIEALMDEFESESLVKSGWFKYDCQICGEMPGPTFERFGDFKHHLEIEHDRDKPEKYRDHLTCLLPENGYLIRYEDTVTGDMVYCNVRDRDPEEGMNKYCQPHQEHVEARNSYKSGIFPALDEIGGETLVITEGEFKSLALKEQGWDSVAIAGVNLSQSNLDRLSHICSQYDLVVYVVDDDMGGLLSVPSMTSEMNYRDQRIMVQVSEDKDIDDKHAENKEFELEPEKPLDLLINHSERLEEKEHLISKYGKSETLLEVFYQCVQGLNRGKQESEIKNVVDTVNKDLGTQYGKNTVISQLNDWRKAFHREKRKQESQEEETTEVQEFQSTIEIEGEEIALNPVEYVNLKEHVKTETEILQNDKKVLRPDKKFKIYKISFDKGQEEEEYRLLVPPEKKLNLGDKYIPLKMADLDKEEYSEWIRSDYKEAVSEGYEGSFQDFKRENFEDVTFEIAGHLNSESIEKIKGLSNETIKHEILEKYLNNGFDYDSDLRRLNHPKIIRHDKTIIEPQDVMPQNPHSAYITGTKVGKSFDSGRVGTVRTRVSSSGLLGYASADDVREGTLDGMVKPFFADEIRHGSEENVGDNLLTILEKGEAPISKGQKDMKPKFYGSFTYMSNPQSEDDNKNQVDYFLDFIQKIGNNARASGSRLGVLLLDLGEMYKASGKPLNKEKRNKLETVVEWIKEEASTEYSKIELELQEWLNQEYPHEYTKQVKNWKEKIFSEKAEEFLEGHVESYRHARGQALRMAVYERMSDVLNREYDVNELRCLADEKFQEVMNINLRSISNLSSKLGDRETVVKRKEALLEAEDNLYVKLFVKTVTAHYKEKPESLKDIEPVDSLQPAYKKLREELEPVEEGDWYWKWSRIKEAIRDNITRINGRLEDRYGLTVTEDHDTLFVKGSDLKTFRYYKDLSEDSLPEISLGEESEESEVEESVKNNTHPPSNQGESEETGEDEGGGVDSNKEIPTSQTSQTSPEKEESGENEGNSVIFDKDPEIGEEIEKKTAVKILNLFQQEGEMKKQEAHKKIGSQISEFNKKISDLKALNYLSYDQHSHQYQLSSEGKGFLNNQGLEQVIE